MGDTVEVSIPVDAAAAAVLADAGKRAAIGRIISDILRREAGDMRPKADLQAGYLAMAADVEREAEALEWIESLVGDVADEPPRHGR